MNNTTGHAHDETAWLQLARRLQKQQLLWYPWLEHRLENNHKQIQQSCPTTYSNTCKKQGKGIRQG